MKTKKYPLLLDCDTGEDDAIAIVLAIMSGLPLKYIITCHGNTTLGNATRNSSRIVSLLDASKIKIIKGANGPTKPHLWEPPGFTAGTDFLGYNGLCNVKLPPSKYKNVIDSGQEKYIKELAKLIKKEERVDYIITGPCTNFAKLCNYMGKDIKKHINSLYIMGGAIYVKGARGAGVKNTSHKKGNKAPDTWAEFNFYCDPYAIKKVLQFDLHPVVVTWDQCINFELPFTYINKMKASKPGGKFIVRLMHAFMKIYGLKNKTKFELCDPLTVMSYMGYGHLKNDKINITTAKKYFGKSYHDEKGYSIKYFYVKSKVEINSIIAEMMRKLGIK
ncbi:nucleoside hydrolase [Candidatus Gottesmanbacteria bacterium]|nr:nucleoside hydrolase [Candidatus Gottesmanbacteria bacterium]